MTNAQIIGQGNHLHLLRRGGWEYVHRKNASGIVIILAMTDDQSVIFVEQYRPPVLPRVIEFPAGLAGDIPGAEAEPLAEAAKRELLEETGYAASEMIHIVDGVSSAGLSDEVVSFFVARGLHKSGPGGGDASEEIEVHVIPLADVDAWLTARQAQGCLLDSRLYTGLYLLERT